MTPVEKLYALMDASFACEKHMLRIREDDTMSYAQKQELISSVRETRRGTLVALRNTLAEVLGINRRDAA